MEQQKYIVQYQHTTRGWLNIWITEYSNWRSGWSAYSLACIKYPSLAIRLVKFEGEHQFVLEQHSPPETIKASTNWQSEGF